jgi:hypothetical protein
MATMPSDLPPMLDKKAFLASYKVPGWQRCPQIRRRRRLLTMLPPAPSAVAVAKTAGRGRGQIEVVRAVIEVANGLG